jgi:hypothetical protein
LVIVGLTERLSVYVSFYRHGTILRHETRLKKGQKVRRQEDQKVRIKGLTLTGTRAHREKIF